MTNDKKIFELQRCYAEKKEGEKFSGVEKSKKRKKRMRKKGKKIKRKKKGEKGEKKKKEKRENEKNKYIDTHKTHTHTHTLIYLPWK